MRLTLKRRITSGLVVIVTIALASMLIIRAGLVNVQNTLHSSADLEASGLAAAYKMGSKIGCQAVAVLRYVHRGDPQERAHAAEDHADFERAYSEYGRVAKSDEARALARRLRDEYDHFRSLGSRLMLKRDRQDERFASAMRRFERIDDFIDRELYFRHSQPGAIRPIATVLDTGTNAAELRLWVANYRRSGLEVQRTYAERRMEHFERALADFKLSTNHPDGLRAFPRLEQPFEDVVGVLARVQGIEAGLQAESRTFSAMRQRIEELLDNEIQVAELKALAAPRLAADRATSSLVFLATLLMPTCLLTSGVIGFVLIRSIAQPIEGTTGPKTSLEISESRLHELKAELSSQIAQRERAEEERVRLQAALRRSEMLSALGSIVAGVSHEVRNPLFGISSTVDALEARLRRDQSDAKYARHVEVLRGGLERLTRLMQDLLDYGKPQSIDITESSVPEAVRASVDACELVAKQKGVTIAMWIAPGVEVWPMDRAKIEQVLRNLLENAIQHSPGGTVTLDAYRVLHDEARHLQMQVRDQGPGFDPSELARVFEPFFTQRCGGTGLGLSIVERIVDAHGGTVRAANCPTGGAEITVDLPRSARKVSRAEVVGAV